MLVEILAGFAEIVVDFVETVADLVETVVEIEADSNLDQVGQVDSVVDFHLGTADSQIEFHCVVVSSADSFVEYHADQEALVDENLAGSAADFHLANSRLVAEYFDLDVPVAAGQ